MGSYMCTVYIRCKVQLMLHCSIRACTIKLFLLIQELLNKSTAKAFCQSVTQTVDDETIKVKRMHTLGITLLVKVSNYK